MSTRSRPAAPCWMVALLGIDGLQYVYRVQAPEDALAADLFWSAFHCHEETPHPRVSDEFDSAEIWRGDDRGTDTPS